MHSHYRRPLVLCGALALVFSSLPLSAAEGSPNTKKNENWRIEQRQRWFEDSRGLKRQLNAGRLRREAVRGLKIQQMARQSTALAAGEVWSEMGPSAMSMSGWAMGRVSGRNNAIVPLPNDDNTLYFGAAAGGVWKTTDGGANWQPIFDAVGTQPIGAIHLDPANPSRVWVGTGDKNGGGCAGYFGQGVFLSTDAGANWQARSGSGASAMPLSIVNSIAVAPGNGALVLAAGFGSCDANGSLSGGGIYRSADGGASWARVYSGKVEDMAYAADGATLYASVPATGVVKSTNGGTSWTSASSGLAAGTSRMRLALAPSNAQVLYALMDSGGLYRSTDGGASWSLRKSGACEGQCSYNLALAVHPTDANKVLVGSIRFALSTDGGATLNTLTSDWGDTQQVHQDTHTLTWSKTSAGRFWVGSDGGIWRSDNSGGSFSNLNSNLNVTQFYDVAVDGSDGNRLFGGAQDNSSSGRSTSKLWGLTYASGDGFMNHIDPSNPSTVLQTSYPYNNRPSIVRSTTGGGGGSFDDLATTGLSPSGNFPWVTPLAGAGSLVWVASDSVYVGTSSASSFRWYPLSGNLGSAASVLSPIQSGGAYKLFVGTSGGKIYASSTATATGGSLSEVTGNYPGGRVSDIAIDPTNTQRVFATRGVFSGGHLYRSVSGGTTWTPVGSGLPAVPANAVAIDPLAPQRIFVGTDIGVYASSNGGDSFQAFSAGLPLGLVVMDLEIDAEPHILVAGTYGRGAWKLELGGSAGNQPPVSAFGYTKNQLTVNFTDQSSDPDGTIAARAWKFGDGSTSSSANPSKTYGAAGTYSVELTVTDNEGASHSSSQSVTVSLDSVCAGTTLNGSFSGGTGQTQYQPNGSYYQSTGSGTHKACLSGPANADYDLYLDKWSGGRWTQVAKSDGPSASETLSYNGTAGYYLYRVVNYSGTGAYHFTYSKPN